MPRDPSLMLIFALVVWCACASQRTTPEPAVPSATPAAPALNVGALVTQLATQDGCQDSTAEMRLSAQGEDGRRETLEFRLQRKYSPTQVSTLLTVLAPREESEKALLAIERPEQATEAFSYLAGLKRLARLSSSGQVSFRSSRVTVQELLGLELSQYQPKPAERVTEGEERLVKIEFAEKRDRSLAFPRIVGFFRESSEEPARFELYNARGEVVKTVRVEEIQRPQNYRTLTRLAISDHKQNQELRLEVLKIKYDQKLPDTLFGEDHLIKLVSEASRKLIAKP
jgi:hypothetical protein